MWLQPFLFFLLGLALFSPLGAASYFLGRWFRRVQPSLSWVGDVVLSLIGLAFLSLNLILVLPLCYAGALATRYNEGHKHSIFRLMVQLLSSTTFPMLFIVFVALALAYMLPAFSSALIAFLNARFMTVGGTDTDLMAILWGAMLGLMVAPCAIPITIGVWHSSKLRPGLDRPLT